MPVEFNWKIAGFAGEGIMTSGLLLGKTCARDGLFVFDYTEYPSLIRGGHNTYQVLISNQEVSCQKKQVDLLLALNKNALVFHQKELHTKSLVIYDGQDDKIEIEKFKLPCPSFNLPMVRLAEESGGSRLMANNVALGASVFLLGLELKTLNQLISEVFAKKVRALKSVLVHA
jgi:2-oxoglutarate ferredoxin oxidoreductase subunit alpha